MSIGHEKGRGWDVPLCVVERGCNISLGRVWYDWSYWTPYPFNWEKLRFLELLTHGKVVGVTLALSRIPHVV